MFRLLRLLLLLLVREGQSRDDKGWFSRALICFVFVPFVAVVSYRSWLYHTFITHGSLRNISLTESISGLIQVKP